MPHTILIVDDNDAFRGMLRTALEARGYRTLLARNGAAGLELAAASAVDAALVDVGMEEMDGFEFCRRLREQNQASGREFPVWIMTGILQPGLTKRAEAVGALVVLRKPLNLEEICGKFEREFRERTARARPPEAGDSD